jgi:hypothetical protein
MRTILIAQRDMGFAEELAAQFRATGFFTIVTCPGPWPPLRCVRCDKGYCPLTEGADVMIYDPKLTGLDAEGQPHTLAVESALAHPDVPMLLAWPSSSVLDPGTLRDIRMVAPHIRVAARESTELLEQIRSLLEAPTPDEVATPA